MKISIKHFIPAAMLCALALTACDEDAMVVNPDTAHDKSTATEEVISSKGHLDSKNYPGGDMILFRIGSPEQTGLDPSELKYTDEVRLILPEAADKDRTFRIGMNPLYAGGDYYYGQSITIPFNKEHYMECQTLTGSGGLGNNLSLNGDGECIVTIKAGQTTSDAVKLEFNGQGMMVNDAYMFPIQATDTESGELITELPYICSVAAGIDYLVGEKPTVNIAYIDMETMNPLIATQFMIDVTHSDFNTGEDVKLYYGKLLDIVNIRTSYIKKDGNGHVKLFLNPDLEYVLKNRLRYLYPIQRDGIKVCIAIKGGGTGIGFANMSDEQIADFTAQVKTVVDLYDIDGVNLWDESAGYDIEGSPAVSGMAYARLIKSLKGAMPDKLLTLVDTRETTEALCDPQDGISVGDYLDYAWSSLEDYIAPYEPSPTSRALAGMPEKRYGTIFMRDIVHMSNEEQEALVMGEGVLGPFMAGTRFDKLSGTDVIVSDYDYGKESMWNEPWNIGMMAKFPMPEDFSFMVMTMVKPTKLVWTYYAFKKDW
ncbi:glycosyl hydrolase family 18 protein [uncultured Muribaculum sp.]|uniref:glycosyl hydrolase family 18 protein n=1 Tax=uncultured Muribaculum sp. TaxID=1918613 RepID=UPI0025F90450|nr:glycosyl hydrolase family 18 protein [uncultured Muribaculum sp.]